MAVIIFCIVAIVVASEVFLKSDKNECLVNISNKEEISEAKDNIEVYIVGCIKKPGVYEVPRGATIEKVVKQAGGFTKDADQERINLVYKIKDNMMLVIKDKNQRDLEEDDERIKKSAIELVKGIYQGQSVPKNDEPVNINTATKEELARLPGIGNSMAEKIIKYREKYGDFESIEDLKNVNGIGDNKFNSIKDMLMV